MWLFLDNTIKHFDLAVLNDIQYSDAQMLKINTQALTQQIGIQAQNIYDINMQANREQMCKAVIVKNTQ